jgi:hypothetical protein
MANIRNKTTGRVFHEVDSQTAALFVDAGLYEHFKPVQTSSAPAPLPTSPTFTIAQNQFTGRSEIVLTHPGGQITRYSGPQGVGVIQPSQIRDAFKATAWCAAEERQVLTGPEPSEAIINEFISRLKQEAEQRKATAALIAGRQ